MTEVRRLNVRVSDHARDVLVRTAARLRKDDAFAARLSALLDATEDETAGDGLAERVARLEARLDVLESDIRESDRPGLPGTRTDARSRVARDDVLQFLPGGESPANAEKRVAPADTPPPKTADQPQFTTGEGKGRRLTTAGEIEAERRILAGESDATIADFLGVGLATVRQQRKKVEGRLL